MIKIKHKILLAATVIIALYTAWQWVRPVEMVDIHINNFGQETFANYIIVRNFPITERGKITWWENNKSMLKEKYGIPQTDADNSFSISVWDFGDGYQVEKPKEDSFFPSRDTSYLLCFDDMPVKENCIEKKQLMSITKNGTSNITYFAVRGLLKSSEYIQTPGNEQIRAIANE